MLKPYLHKTTMSDRSNYRLYKAKCTYARDTYIRAMNRLTKIWATFVADLHVNCWMCGINIDGVNLSYVNLTNRQFLHKMMEYAKTMYSICHELDTEPYRLMLLIDSMSLSDIMRRAISLTDIFECAEYDDLRHIDAQIFRVEKKYSDLADYENDCKFLNEDDRHNAMHKISYQRMALDALYQKYLLNRIYLRKEAYGKFIDINQEQRDALNLVYSYVTTMSNDFIRIRDKQKRVASFAIATGSNRCTPSSSTALSKNMVLFIGGVRL